LKDAFRNAVEQVVGMVVDSTIQAENDEIIREQILTASDGFIAEYKMISSNVEDGLTRVRIKAVVERKSLVQKLEAKQIVVKNVNMDNLFAKVVSDAQAVEGASAVLAERLKEFHKVWTAKAGEPNYDRNKSELSIPLVISADQTAYAACASRLAQVLDKISIRKGRKILTSIECKTKDGKPTPSRKIVRFASTPDQISGIQFSHEVASNPNYGAIQWKNYKVTEWLKAEEFDQLPKNAIWIWLCLSDKNFTTEWVGYAVDVNLDEIGPLLFPQWSISMILRDGNDTAIGSYEIQNLTFQSHFFNNVDPCREDQWGHRDEDNAPMGIHPHLIGMGDPKYNRSGMGTRRSIEKDVTSFRTKNSSESFQHLQCLLAPNFMSVANDFDPRGNEGNFAYWKHEVVEAKFNISQDEIKDTKKTEISISAEPRTIKTK
jgi:hypothetical protein